jgi:putative nucleotidyltransferase with HDIG domain
MNSEALQSLQNWFSAYCGAFSLPADEDQKNIELKRLHTHEVCLNAGRIALDLNMDPHSSALAAAAALFHDVGRFQQYERYKTFDDSISVNHAALGVRVLVKHKALGGLRKPDQDVIIRSVMLHNVFSLPQDLDDETRLFAQLVRDADKLDILRVFIEYYEQDEKSRSGAVALGLPATPGYSQDVLACLKNGTMAKKSMLRNQNDFKLLQLAWVYDLHFFSSLQMLMERDLIRRVAEKLPDTREITQATETVQRYVDKRLRSR